MTSRSHLFAVLLPGCSLRDGRAVLERLRAAAPGETATDVLTRADAALYEARDTGRDRLRAA